jgi:hypothetical protein
MWEAGTHHGPPQQAMLWRHPAHQGATWVELGAPPWVLPVLPVAGRRQAEAAAALQTLRSSGCMLGAWTA